MRLGKTQKQATYVPTKTARDMYDNGESLTLDFDDDTLLTMPVYIS